MSRTKTCQTCGWPMGTLEAYNERCPCEDGPDECPKHAGICWADYNGGAHRPKINVSEDPAGIARVLSGVAEAIKAGRADKVLRDAAREESMKRQEPKPAKTAKTNDAEPPKAKRLREFVGWRVRWEHLQWLRDQKTYRSRWDGGMTEVIALPDARRRAEALVARGPENVRGIRIVRVYRILRPSEKP